MALYKDFDLSFEKNIQNDIDCVYNEKSIQNSIKNIILPKRNTYNRFQKPTIGTNIARLLGNRANPFVSLQIEDEIEVAITNFEPRVKLMNIKSEYGNIIGVYSLQITYLIIMTKVVDTLTVDLAVII